MFRPFCANALAANYTERHKLLRVVYQGTTSVVPQKMHLTSGLQSLCDNFGCSAGAALYKRRIY